MLINKMKVVVFLGLVFIGFTAARVNPITDDDLDEDWKAWTARFGKSYTGREELKRRLIWENNLKQIQHHNLAHNRGETSFTIGLNQFSDQTVSELTENLKVVSHAKSHRRNLKTSDSGPDCKPNVNFNVNLPASVDWRKEGYVTPVKNAAPCLSAQYVAITGAMEGQWFRNTGRLNALSEQNIADCCGTGPSPGRCTSECSLDEAYQLIKTQGIESLADYPYTGAKEPCNFNPKKRAAMVSGYDYVSPNETSLQTILAAIGPISVVVDASQPSFWMYTSGVYNEPACSSTSVNLPMLVVGYDTDPAGGDYWIVRNTQGPEWGNQGYIWMSRNRDNQCGIASSATYPFFSC